MTTSVYRVDKFAVPPDVLPAFLERVRHIDGLLATQPGCKQHLVLTQTQGPGEFNVVTIVEGPTLRRWRRPGRSRRRISAAMVSIPQAS